MNHIDREMEQVERQRRSVTLFSTVGAFASPVHHALARRPVQEPWLRQASRAIERAVDAILTWRERVRMRRQLLSLDDRLLKDIGITRLQAQSEAEKPFWQV
jgi:uncharacterized protein YjiS (DUF1127 family)